MNDKLIEIKNHPSNSKDLYEKKIDDEEESHQDVEYKEKVNFFFYISI